MKSLALIICSSLLAEAHSTIDLKVNHQQLVAPAPVVVDDAVPRLSWRIEASDEAVGLKQSAYEILVATCPEKLESGMADLWESGRVNSHETSVAYAGKLCPPRHGCIGKPAPGLANPTPDGRTPAGF